MYLLAAVTHSSCSDL